MIQKNKIVLEAENLKLVKGGQEIFAIEHFALEEGEVIALVGPNGAGKTSLLLTLALLEHPTQGYLHFNGTPASREKILALRRQMAVVFQEPLLMDTTVLRNVLTGLQIRGVPPRLARQRAEEWLDRLGIIHLKNRVTRHLSGGESQRVNLARAFALQPRILFLDEPFAALDYPTRNALLLDIGRILKETRVTTLFVTHDYTEIPFIAQRVAVMLNGRIVKSGTVEKVLGEVASCQKISVPWETF